MQSSPDLDVVVQRVEERDDPAGLLTELRVGPLTFHSQIAYHSIPSWRALWERYGDALKPQLLGTVVAWDCMRFLALGGERLILPRGLSCPPDVAEIWSYCFRAQFGEWRYRNRLEYPSPYHPRLVADATPDMPLRMAPVEQRTHNRRLLSNGGGKDTLAGMLLLNDAGIRYDVYEGHLPIGGELALQRQLLTRLREAAAPADTERIAVSVVDDFFDRPALAFERAGVRVKHYKTDFAVGHTANYPGFFPIILHHEYGEVSFNVERSAERTMVSWGGEAINHQWCKTASYRQLCTRLLNRLTGVAWFRGFDSTLSGLNDIAIYAIVSSEPALLRLTHSCNYGKPWCGRCPKCCFCYLMMTAFLGESFAREVVGAERSLFDDPSNAEIWSTLLDPREVAWECVPSHEECQVAARLCTRQGRQSPVERFAPTAARFADLWSRYATVEWSAVPEALRSAVAERLARWEQRRGDTPAGQWSATGSAP